MHVHKCIQIFVMYIIFVMLYIYIYADFISSICIQICMTLFPSITYKYIELYHSETWFEKKDVIKKTYVNV